MAQPRSASAASVASSRPRQTSTSSRSPLESLIYVLVPSLAPPRRSAQQDDGSGAPSRGSTVSTRPGSRTGGTDDVEKERERKLVVRELLEWCERTIDGELPSTAPLVGSALPDAARRMLAESKASDKGRTGADKALRFGGLWKKLERGHTLSSPVPHLQFLMALSALEKADAVAPSRAGSSKSQMLPPPAPVFPSNGPGPAPRTAPAGSSRHALQDTDANIPTADWKGKGKSKADALRAWRSAHGRPAFPDLLLLRDTLYLLQGIDGRYVRFAIRPPKEKNPYLTEKGRAGDGAGFALGKDGAPQVVDPGDEGDVVGIDIVVDEGKDGFVSQPIRTILAQLSEMGMLYRKIITFCNKTQANEGKEGMVVQSLSHFLHHELSEYHRLLAVLESQLTDDDEVKDETRTEPSLESSKLTLLRLGLWTDEMRLKLKMMDLVVDDANNSHGGTLVSRLHAHTAHGDPLIRNFMDSILSAVSKPFFTTLQRWIFSGELHDPFQEFFVQRDTDVSLREGSGGPLEAADVGFEVGFDAIGGAEEAGRIWEKKYVFVKAMVPGFISEAFARKIFSTGRSLNFMRYTCRDTGWIDSQAKLANDGHALVYSDLSGLERSIDDAFSAASQRLLEIFYDRFMLLDHLRALKSYLMLGAGDFAEMLMEAISPRLSKPAISLYRHHLTSDLETAIRGSNAQYDSPDVLRRLDARILEYSHGEVGWDCFSLEYKVEAPLNAVLDSKAMVEYEKLFHHLWRLRRVETALTQGWMRVTSGSRLFETIPALSNEWHHCRIVQAEMVHFLRQLQAFCQLEVIECSWQNFMDFTAKRSGDLDALIHAHRSYLDRVVRKVLLLTSKRDKEEILLDLVRDALDAILQFRDSTDDLYAWSLEEATRIDRERDEERGLYTGDGGGGAEADPLRSIEKLRAIRERVRACSINFQDRVVSVCHLAANHQDLDIRFLAIRIAFNGHYQLKRASSSKSGSKSARPTTHGTVDK